MPYKYDVFLSHNSKDKPAVQELAERLEDEAGIKVFLDIWNLIPGDPWQEDLEEALDQSWTVAVFLSPSGVSGWHNEEMRNALNIRVWDRKRRVIPVLLPGTKMPEEEEIPGFLRRLTWVDFRNGLDDDEAFGRLVSGIKGVPPGRREKQKGILPILDNHPKSLADVLLIYPENDGQFPHEAGPGQWFSRLRVESNQEVRNCQGILYSIYRLSGIDDIKGVALPRSTESILSWARGTGTFAPIDLTPGRSEYLDIAWRADDPPIPKNELRISSALDRGVRKRNKFGTRQDFISLEPGYYKLVVRTLAEGFRPVQRTYRLHWSGSGFEKGISLIELTGLENTIKVDSESKTPSAAPTQIKNIPAISAGPVDNWNLKHPYAMPPNFTGRVDERKMLMDWLNRDNENRLLILRALGGFGKSALVWYLLTHDVDPNQWPKILWWSFYEGDASFEHFVEETINYLKLDVPQGQRTRVEELLKTMQGEKILFIMDGFERALRAYKSMSAAYQGDEEPQSEVNQLACLNANAEIFLKSVCSLPNMRSKILITTRLTPSAVKLRGECLQGCREEILEAMKKEDAVEYFYKQKINGTRDEIKAACESYGFHPLSLHLLSGLIVNDLRIPRDIAVAKQLDISKDIIHNRYHVLKEAYECLPTISRKMLSVISCFLGKVKYETLEYLSPKLFPRELKNGKAKIRLDRIIHTLLTRGLLARDEQICFQLHPIVKQYAYSRFSLKEKRRVHEVLAGYFDMIWDEFLIEKRFETSTDIFLVGLNGEILDVIPRSREQISEILKNIGREAISRLCVLYGKDTRTLQDLWPAIEGYHHHVLAENYDQAVTIFDNNLQFTLRDYGAYNLQIQLLDELINNIGNRALYQKHLPLAHHFLAESYGLMGQPQKAIQLLNKSADFLTVQERSEWIVKLFYDFAVVEIALGLFREADEHLNRYIDFGEGHGSYWVQMEGVFETGLLLLYRGEWENAAKHFDYGEYLREREINSIWYGIPDQYNAIWAITMLRAIDMDPELASKHSRDGLITQALKFSSDFFTWVKYFEEQRRLVREHLAWAYLLLGSANRICQQFEMAFFYLDQALIECRNISLVEIESKALLEIARLHYNLKNYGEAKSLAEEALTITERCGYILQGADVNLFLAQYTLEQEENKIKAQEYAKTALKLAYCEGPPYYYKIAYEEAEHLLGKLDRL